MKPFIHSLLCLPFFFYRRSPAVENDSVQKKIPLIPFHLVDQRMATNDANCSGFSARSVTQIRFALAERRGESTSIMGKTTADQQAHSCQTFINELSNRSIRKSKLHLGSVYMNSYHRR